MKKIKCFSLLLSLLMLLSCIVPAAATEVTTQDNTIAVVPQTLPQEEELTFGTVCIKNGCRTINGLMPLGGSDRKLDTAQAAFLYETNTGTVVYSYNPDAKVASGTLSKIVTAMVTLDHLKLEDSITINTDNISRLGGATNVDLRNGETVTVEDLLCCLLMENANDAAVVLAEKVAGNQSSFVTLMNQKAKEVGCTNTEFGNIHGLDTAPNITSARDMAKLVQAAIQNEDFVKIFGMETYTVPETEKSKERELLTTNYFLSNRIIPDFQDERVKGGMQSMTNAAGASIVLTAEHKNMKYIAVVLGAVRTYKENGWSVESYGNFNEMTDLIRHGFEKYKINRIIYDGMSLSQFAVIGGESNAVGQANVNVDSVVPINAQMGNLQMNYKVTNNGLTAPVKKGDLIATLEVKYLNSVMTEVEVYAMGNVKSADNTGVVIRSTATRSDADDSGILSVIGTICVIILGLAVAYLGFNAYMRSRLRARRKKRRAARRRNRE